MREFTYQEKYGHLINEMIADIRKQSLYFIGPDCTVLIEKLCGEMTLKPGMRVLDMGCGAGFTSIILAKEFGVTVFANALWFSAGDNYQRFLKAGVADKIIPIQAEARHLPYADGYFDAALSIDSYHYFGADQDYLPQYYARLVKQGGQLGLVSPGLTREFTNGVPEAMKPYFDDDMLRTFHSAQWWRGLWEETGTVDVTKAENIPNGKEIWRATADFDLHDADTENYLALILMTAVKK
jgi:cyclopropane fatty-acyl-phospholipid synthase-like methyltransferase